MAVIDLRQWNDLDILSSRFYPLEGLRALPQNADGEGFRAGGATRLWKGQLAIAKKRFADALSFRAKLSNAISPGNVLLWHDPTHDGVSITATSLSVSGNTIRVYGLTGNRQFRSGDYVGWTSSDNITHLHQFVGDKTSGNLNSSDIVVTPPPRITGTVTTTVTIGQAPLKCFIIPGSIDWLGANGSLDDGVSFDWIQTLGDYV